MGPFNSLLVSVSDDIIICLCLWLNLHRCQHCKVLIPTWEELAKKYGNSKTVKIGEVDCTVEEDVCTVYGVKCHT